MKAWIAALLSTICASSLAQGVDSKGDARSLMQSGVKLLEAKDYLGALAVFKDAYARFQSAKILLNIGTTEKLLDRKADAANAYQRYLDAADTDPAKKADVLAELAELDKSTGRLELHIEPATAEVQLGDEWFPATQIKLWRVAPGPFSVTARAAGFEAKEIHGEVVSAGIQPVTLALERTVAPAIVREPQITVIAPPAPEQPRSRYGGFVVAHVSVVPKLGSAVLVGATADATERLSFEAAVILGPGLVSSGSATQAPPELGAYAGAAFAFLTGDLRPRVSAGIPVFFDSGARFFVRGAVGVEYVSSRHVSLALDLGGEIDLNAQMDIRRFALVPAVGIVGRL
jgi:hypothetical protein